MPIDKANSNIEGHQDHEGCLDRDGHEPWDEDKDLAGDGDVSNQQCHSGDNVPTSCEQHFNFVFTTLSLYPAAVVVVFCCWVVVGVPIENGKSVLVDIIAFVEQLV